MDRKKNYLQEYSIISKSRGFFCQSQKQIKIYIYTELLTGGDYSGFILLCIKFCNFFFLECL